MTSRGVLQVLSGNDYYNRNSLDMNNVMSEHADELASWGLGELGDGTSGYDSKYSYSSSPAQYEPVVKTYGPSGGPPSSYGPSGGPPSSYGSSGGPPSSYGSSGGGPLSSYGQSGPPSSPYAEKYVKRVDENQVSDNINIHVTIWLQVFRNLFKLRKFVF